MRAKAALCCLLAACAGTETGNPSFEGTLGYASYSSDSQSVALRAADGGAIAVTEAWLVLGDVRFAPRGDCDAQAELAVAAHALGAGDHARESGTVTQLELVPGRYCGVRLPLLRADRASEAGPLHLAGHSIAIEGMLPDGRQFAIRSALQEDLFLAATADDGFEMSDELSAVTIGFDVAVWCAGLAWETAAPSGDGSIEIDADHNRALLERFERNIGAGTALFRDADASGVITVESRRIAGFEAP